MKQTSVIILQCVSLLNIVIKLFTYVLTYNRLKVGLYTPKVGLLLLFVSFI